MTGETKHEARIRTLAQELWEQEGRPKGREADYLDRARILVGIEENPGAGQEPNPATAAPPRLDEAELQENLGEFPSRFTDQGDRPQTPARRR